MKKNNEGMTLVELMIAITVAGIFLLGMITAFKALNRGTSTAKTRTIANNLAQEKVESLKDLNYYRLRVTTITALSNPYDSSNPYPPESLTIDNISFTRFTIIRKVKEIAGSLVELSPNDEDVGLKKVEITVTWTENSTPASFSIRNLRDNPDRAVLDGTIRGEIREQGTGTLIQDVYVTVKDNPAYGGYSNASGVYTISVPVGTCQVRASKREYNTQDSTTITVTSGSTITYDFSSLTLRSKGNVRGKVYYCDHPVISHIATGTSDAAIEFIELYNPTIYSGPVDGVLTVQYVDNTNNIIDIPITILNNNVQSYGYYLLASANPLTGSIGGFPFSITPDATFAPIMEAEKGGIRIVDSTGQIMDKVGWSKSGFSAPSNAVENSGIVAGANGLETGHSILRKTRSGAAISNEGNSFDININSDDFFYLTSISRLPRNVSSSTRTPYSGTPYPGSIVFADDGLSYSITSDYSGTYTLTDVEAKTCTLSSSGGYYYTAVGITAVAGSTITQDLVMTGTTNLGYIAGEVKTGSTPLNNILVYADGIQGYTDSSGYYRLPIESGTHYVIANYNNTNITYTSETSTTPITVYVGQISSGINFNLSSGGSISGTITTNGVDPLPNIVIIAKDFWGVQRSDAISDTNGNYTLSNLATTNNPYTIMPTLDTSETCTPSSMVISAAAATTTTGVDFRISTGLCNVSGNVRTSTGLTITTGVLIIATTDSITSASPPTVDSSFRSGTVVYYSTMSNSQGSFSFQIRGSASPGTSYNVYGWYTNISGTTSKQSTSLTATTGGNVTNVNLTY